MAVLGMPVDRVRRQAWTVNPGEVLLTLLLAVPFVLGWLAGAAVAAVMWVWAALVAGFRSAPGRVPRIPQNRKERR